MESETSTLRPIASLFAGYELPVAPKKRTSERSELVRYFFEHAKTDWGGSRPLEVRYVGFKLAHLKVRDLYALKSMCEDRATRGYPWAKFFWGSLKEHDWDSELVGVPT